MVAFDGTTAARYALPTLTTMRQPVDEMASTAVQTLLARVADPALPTRATVLRSHRVVGESCGCGAQG